MTSDRGTWWSPRAAAAAVLVVLVVLVMLAACGPDREPAGQEPPDTAASSAPTATPQSTGPTTPSLTPSRPAAAPSSRPRPAPSERSPDPRWRFFTDDHRWHASPWFTGRHRVMIGYGCNAAPWYSPDPRCAGTQGFHHGVDVAMSCGTPVLAGLSGTVVGPDEPGAPGPAYGAQPLRIRLDDRRHDVVLGHVTAVRVGPGDRVRPGERLADASDSGAPDGCHLHVEVRPAGADHSAAVDPGPWLRLAGRPD